ncbi:Arginine deiminase [Nocardioides aquaticus]|uniref:Arginine deiminase n=1 Tax=Nocardioides aquaticus TaxID=160826 RepID=A0ABX8EHS7_9ACTN|nr:Arginine deiminase [Nocardioides aquaticus]
MTFHVDSEVGTLRQAIVHRPGLELDRLTPTASTTCCSTT